MSERTAEKLLETSVVRGLKKAKREDSLYNRYILLNHMIDNWLEMRWFTEEGKAIITLANQQQRAIRDRMPVGWVRLPLA